MGRYIKALAAAIGLWLATPATALAGPTIAVSVGLPGPMIVAPAPIYFTLTSPGPDYVWVEGGYRYDDFGRLVWVPGHWRLRTYVHPIVVGRPYVAPRPVVVHRPVVKPRPVVVVHDHDRKHKHRH